MSPPTYYVTVASLTDPSPSGSSDDLPWTRSRWPVLDPLVDHPHSHPGRHPAAHTAGLHTVEGNAHAHTHRIPVQCIFKSNQVHLQQILLPCIFFSNFVFSQLYPCHHTGLLTLYLSISQLFGFFLLSCALLCSIIILLLPAHSCVSISSLVFMFVLCLSPPLFILCPLISMWKLPIPKSLVHFISGCFPSSLHTSLGLICRPVRVLQAHRAAPTLWDGVLPRPLGGPTLGGGEAGVRTIMQSLFHSGLLSPPPLPPSGKKNTPPKKALFLRRCGWWCS